jgi:predicted dehydrogenase
VGKINTLIIGMGYWGPKLARNIQLNPNFELVGVCDLDTVKATKELERIGVQDIQVFSNFEQALTELDFSFVIVATNPKNHFGISKSIIESKKNILIEKPIGLNLNEKISLIELANLCDVKIFADFTYLFTPEFIKIKEIIQSGDIGDLGFYHSTRVNLGLVQKDVDVIDDLLIHDLAILDQLKSKIPVAVSCAGNVFNETGIISSAACWLKYDDGFIANLVVSWNSPVKVRNIELIGSLGTIIWNDVLGADKIKVFNGNIYSISENGQNSIFYHVGDGRIPSIRSSEALSNELNHISSVLTEDSQNSLIIGPDSIYRIGTTLSLVKDSINKNDDI